MAATSFIFPKTNPTPLIFALLACNVIASIILPCFYFARRTGFDVLILSGPFVEFIIAYICTPYPTMSSCSTTHTNILTTFTSGCFSQDSSFSYIFQAAVSRTPTEIWIEIDVYVHLKSQVLLKDIL